MKMLWLLLHLVSGSAQPAAAPAAPAAPAAASGSCPAMAGVWRMGAGERIMVLEQDGCTLAGTVQEPRAVLRVRGYWTGQAWTMAASRSQNDGCGTTAWGSIRQADPDRMVITVSGTDGLCDGGTPRQFNGARMTYTRFVPAP